MKLLLQRKKEAQMSHWGKSERAEEGFCPGENASPSGTVTGQELELGPKASPEPPWSSPPPVDQGLVLDSQD